MNKQIRIILAGASFALSSVLNVASGQVLGGGVLGGAGGTLQGTLGGLSGSAMGNGSMGGAFDAAPVLNHGRATLGRTTDIARQSTASVQQRATHTRDAVQNEASGTTTDATSTVSAVQVLAVEQPAALAQSLTTGATAAGTLDVQKAAAPATAAPSTGSQPGDSSLIPVSSLGTTSSSNAPAPTAASGVAPASLPVALTASGQSGTSGSASAATR